jgi:translation initiation factor 1 (eIF-1/SUI1)
MDPALAASLRLLASSPVLREVEARLLAAGAVDVRVVADLAREGVEEFVAAVLGIDRDFSDDEKALLDDFAKKIGVGATVQKRIMEADYGTLTTSLLPCARPSSRRRRRSR